MVHPDFDAAGKLFDHVDGVSMDNWIDYLNTPEHNNVIGK